MPRTVDSLTSAGLPTTMGSTADYGFDRTVYNMRGKPFPTVDQINDLAKVYAAILCKPTGANTLHDALRNKQLRTLLSDYGSFEWVAFMSED